MRADRLLALLLLLQQRGQITAAEAAEELEVSERTARRDLEALSMAGVPVYSRQGRNGGWQLVGGARTDLSGLNADEARALFLVAGPASSATPEVKAALRKLVRALPETFRSEAEAASTAVVVDPTGWGRPARPVDDAPPEHLDALQRAVVRGEQVALGYQARDAEATTRTIHPLGLAARGSVWYLVAHTDNGQRTFRVDRVTAVEPLGEPVERPDGFNLREAWSAIKDEVGGRIAPVRAHGTAEATILEPLRQTFGTRLEVGPPTGDGRVEVQVRGWDDRVLAGELAGWGDLVEIEEPPGVRAQLADIGNQLVARYVGTDATA